MNFFIILVSTFVSEDLTCIGAGILASQGSISLFQAIAACYLGIVIGDMLLFAVGRAGRRALKYPPLSWLVTEDSYNRASEWFQKKGLIAIITSRFIPGMRLPTYLVAGALKTNFLKFSLYFLGAALVWTPLIVCISYYSNESARTYLEATGWQVILGCFALYFLIRFLLRLVSYESRRMLLGTFRKWTRWEFWPSWLSYIPIVFYCAYLSIRFRSLFLFTSCNPGIPGSGLIGESKSEILSSLPGQFVSPFVKIPGNANATQKIKIANAFMRKSRKKFPIVLKPDRGERGTGVAIVRTEEKLREVLNSNQDQILQKYVSGLEFGVFYVRLPTEKRGRITSITRKTMPSLRGDGKSTLKELILADKRAIILARQYMEANAHRLETIPDSDELVQLVELGTHSRGSIFLDGSDLKTDALEKTFDRISTRFSGFYLGRYDVRVPSDKDLMQGKNIQVLELNGLTSEPTHIYDPSVSIFAAYRAMFQQWRMAYEIGKINRDRGHAPLSISEMYRILFQSS